MATSVVVYESPSGQWGWRLVEAGRTVEASRGWYVSRTSASMVAEVYARRRFLASEPTRDEERAGDGH